MYFKDLILANRSYRSYDMSKPIPHEVLLAAIDAARLTPSAANLQPLCYRLIEGEEACAKMLPLTAWARNLPDITLPPVGHAPTAYIVICQNLSVVPNPAASNRDVGIVAQTILLSAAEAGYGGCMIGSFRAEAVVETFGIDPAKYRPQLVVALGKPDEEITLVDLAPGANSAYYRDEDGRHFVPKRRIEDILI